MTSSILRKTILNASKIGAQNSLTYSSLTVDVSVVLNSLIQMPLILNASRIHVPQILKFFLKMGSVSSVQTTPILTIPKTSKNAHLKNALRDKLPSYRDSVKIAHHINFRLDQLQSSTNAKMFHAPKIHRSIARTETAGHARNILTLQMMAPFVLLMNATMRRQFFNWTGDVANVTSSSTRINPVNSVNRRYVMTPIKFSSQLDIAKTALWLSIQMLKIEFAFNKTVLDQRWSG